MPYELQVIAFHLCGKADVLPQPPASQAQPGDAGVDKTSDTTFKEKIKLRVFSGSAEDGQARDMVSKLNGTADTIAEGIEREVKKFLPPEIGVQAHVQFYVGSVLLTGTVALVTWAGSIITQAAREEVEKQLGGFVKTAVQRVMSRVLGEQWLSTQLGPMDVRVTLERSVLTSVSSMSPSLQDRIATVGATSFGRSTSSILAILVIAAAILLIQIVQLLGRYFTLQIKP
ncbi:MAG: hypothetical protein J2P54_00225 [Bradyrhizobiaceae bacterium]|nr:hypothetical protein [Bradyrhizobiaceae bacterium]